MKVSWMLYLSILLLLHTTVGQTKVPKPETTVLVSESEVVIIGRVQRRQYIADESIKSYFDTEKYTGEVVELALEEVLLDRIRTEEQSLRNLTTVRIYVPGRPLGTDRELLFLPNETYLVFLKKHAVEASKSQLLVIWNDSLRKWERFPEASVDYFIVVGAGSGLIPQKKTRGQTCVNA